MSRGMGMPLPLDEIMASFKFDRNGHFIGSATDPSVIVQIAEAVLPPDYARVRAPTLALYALADHWTPDYASFTANERTRLARALPSARIVAIPRSKHYLFLTNRDEVVREVRDFLTELARPTVNLDQNNHARDAAPATRSRSDPRGVRIPAAPE
jgi:pimeloyl-ACP methyl ester carboxylesterase